MIIGGVDIPKKPEWFFNTSAMMNQTMSKPTGSTSNPEGIPAPRELADIVDVNDTAMTWIFSGILNPPLLNSLIQQPNLPTKPAIPNVYRPIKPTGLSTPRLSVATNPMYFFGTSIFSIGFGISLIPQINNALVELGLIEDPESFEYQMNNTF